MKTLCIALYAGDTQDEGTRLGVETKKRCDACIEFIYQHQNQPITVFLGAGTNPDYPHYPLLKEIMKKYLEENLLGLEISSVSIETSPTDVWNTFNESVAIARLVARHQADTLVVISSWYHIPRIVLIWKLIRRNISVSVVRAPSTKFMQVFREALARIKVLLIDYRHWRSNFP